MPFLFKNHSVYNSQCTVYLFIACVLNACIHVYNHWRSYSLCRLLVLQVEVGRLVEHEQPPEVFYKKGALRNLTKFTGKHLWQSILFKLQDRTPLGDCFWYENFLYRAIKALLLEIHPALLKIWNVRQY